ncbi:orphan sodium- and chloride-dependent neurotransmitter transporter NTT5 isoform X1 [Erinaceus europaeus]|uniref:Orphan sodium- and chloride-dependent neurotransmitter transporter NTT5 isoform X1 n=1 Tax=Erinaceus europaeus TaxID=9365 RepID=A0ABM3W138_ERIEU|nr:orphan sodium- and chloride-dependent neurotransmitter transporter NTT5 isoform X1 [Erinaceus europaeus]
MSTEAQTSKSLLASFSSLQEDEPDLRKAEAASESQLEKKTESSSPSLASLPAAATGFSVSPRSQSQEPLAKSPSTDTELSDSFPKSQIWEALDKSLSSNTNLSDYISRNQNLEPLVESSSSDTGLSDSFPRSQVWEALGMSPSTDTELLDSLARSHTWEPLSLPPWVSDTQLLKDRIAKAEAWEAYAWVAQRKISQPRQSSTVDLPLAPVIKNKRSFGAIPKVKKTKAFERPLWSNKFEYILIQLGNTLRPINFFRFSSLWINNGSCIFLIIYVFLMFLVGLPLLFLEMSVGQKAKHGGIATWREMSPWIGGLGYSCIMVCFITSLYLNVTNSWVLAYLVQSFQHPVPWEKCPLLKNSSDFDPECVHTTPSTFYWYRVTLKASDRIEDDGPPALSLILPLFATSSFLCICVISGVKYTGKVMYAFILLPCLILISFCTWSILLKEGVIVRQFLLDANISAIYNINVWYHAGKQVLFTLSLGFGSAVSISSHAKPYTNSFSDALIVVMISLTTTILSTVFILGTLGFWATVIIHRCHEKNAETITDLVIKGKLPAEALPPEYLNDNPTQVFTSWFNNLPQSTRDLVLNFLTECSLEKQLEKVGDGPSFAFLVFTEAMSFIPGSVFWTILFFVFLLSVGLSYLVAITQAIITTLQDTFATSRDCTKLLSVIIFLLLFLCGLFFIRPAGIYYLRLLSEYWAIFPVTVIMILETVAVVQALGVQRSGPRGPPSSSGRFFPRLLGNIPFPCQHPVSYFWMWYCLILVLLLSLLVMSLIRLYHYPMTYVAWDSKTSTKVVRDFPLVYVFSLAGLFTIVVLPVPGYFIYCLIQGIPFNPSIGRDSSASLRSLTRGIKQPFKFMQRKKVLSISRDNGTT